MRRGLESKRSGPDGGLPVGSAPPTAGTSEWVQALSSASGTLLPILNFSYEGTALGSPKNLQMNGCSITGLPTPDSPPEP